MTEGATLYSRQVSGSTPGRCFWVSPFRRFTLCKCRAFHDPEGTAEAYLLDHLPRSAAQAFEEHYINCPRCAAILRQTAEYVVARKRAAQRLRDTGKRSRFG